MEWRKYIIGSFILMILSSCDNKKNKVSNMDDIENQEVNKINVNQSTEPESMEDLEIILKNNGFKFPNDDLFSKKLKEFFDVDKKDYVGKDFIEIKIEKEYVESSESFPEAIINKKFINWYPDEGWDELAFVNMNKYIFYNDQAAFTYLRANSSSGYLISLVQYFGYDKDNQLIDYLFKKTKGTLNDGYAYSLFIGRNGFKGKFQLRRNLFDIYLKENPKVDIYESRFIENIIGNKIYGGNKESDIAFLLDKIVIQCYANNNGGLFCGRVDNILLSNRYLREDFRKNKFYNFDELKGYIENTFEVDFLNQSRKQIKDPDGYTNLRSGKSTSSEIVDKLKTGTYVEVIDDSEDWWYIEVIGGEKIREYKKGYVHKSKIVEQ